MERKFREDFINLWRKYFNEAELPVTFYYSDGEGGAEAVKAGTGPSCVIGSIVKVRKGVSLSFNAESIGCPGGKKYLGYSEKDMPNFEYFLSCGIPGKMEGERFKKSPELVAELLKNWPEFKAPGRNIVFKRWDKLEDADNPQVVIFFARPDVIAGLYTLANYDVAQTDGVIAPMGSGCASIVQNPLVERESARPRAVLGMFDISARPWIAADELSLAVPENKFRSMVENMSESFLITKSWEEIRKRIK